MLSATLYDLDESPSLILGKRTGLHNLHAIALAALVVFVVSLEANGSLDNLVVKLVLYAVLNRNNDGLVHLVGHNLADNGLSHISFTHCYVLLS